MPLSQHSRRSFIQQSTVGAVALSLASQRRVLGANERVVTALIGCGGRGNSFLDRVDFVCDPDQDRVGKSGEKANIASAKRYDDFRKALDNKDIDAVVVATPDHWHAPAAILACQAGKHVYVEKPSSHNFRESQMLVQAARTAKVVVQHGTQQRSSPAMQQAIQMLRDGTIGDVLIAKAWNIQHRGNIGHAQPSDPPANLNYDLWVGPAEYVPYQSNRCHYNWHWWYNFGTGDIGNDGAHEADFARWGLGVDTLPSKATSVGGKYFHDDDQQFPDTATCIMEYPGNGKPGQIRQLIFELRLWTTNYPYNCDSGVEFFGTKGQMMISKRGKFRLLDERNKVVNVKLPDIKGKDGLHFDDFTDAIRNNRKPNADVVEAHRTVAVLHLANLCTRIGRSVEFDPQTESIVGDAEANQLLGRVYRQEGHWAVPKVT